MAGMSGAEGAPTRPLAVIESLSTEGDGVAHVDGKAVFIQGALPGEIVEYDVTRQKPNFDKARVARVVKSSASRVPPGCQHFDICGGCSLQHADVSLQVAAKQRALEDALWHIGRVRPETMMRPIVGPAWGYRHRARLTARHVPKKGGVLVGFHERRSTYVADMTRCEVLPRHVSDLLVPLRGLLGALSAPDRLPQVEVAVGADVTVLVFRNLVPLTPADETLLRAFADRHGIWAWLQPKGPETACPFHPTTGRLDYVLDEFDVRIGFLPTDFTQVNHAVNTALVRRAVGLLDPHPGDTVYDLFCGLGNFSLPIARSGARVIGLEGNPGLVARATRNAAANGLPVEFGVANLFEADQVPDLSRATKLLIDPPRTGAIEVVKAIDPARAPSRIVYVSCDPATLARDAGALVGATGYRLMAAGIANMFPHTSHVESIALFEHASAAAAVT